MNTVLLNTYLKFKRKVTTSLLNGHCPLFTTSITIFTSIKILVKHNTFLAKIYKDGEKLKGVCLKIKMPEMKTFRMSKIASTCLSSILQLILYPMKGKLIF